MNAYDITVNIAGELLFLRVQKATSEDDAIEQVYNSDNIAEYESEDINQLEIVEIEVKK